MVVDPVPLTSTAYATHNPYQVDRWKDGCSRQELEVVVEEVPVALVFNGVSHVVMLATPQDLAEFALGFALSEAIVGSAKDVYDIDVTALEAGMEVNITVASNCFMALKERRRNLAGRTGCGLCGAESLQHAIRPCAPVPAGPVISAETLHRAFDGLRDCQPLHALTGAVHAAAWADIDGNIEFIREDVGRHNALDKLIGAMAKGLSHFDKGLTLLTSRASCEMVQKAATIGMTIVAAISAPTGLAIRLAEQSGVTLIGFARDRNYAVYANPGRIL